MSFDLIKTLHILSATWLFGAGCSTAFHMFWAWRSRDGRIIRRAARGVVLADWMFVVIPGVVQPLTGFILIRETGIDPWSSWLVMAYGLYVLTFACWLPVAFIQIRLGRGDDLITSGDENRFRRWLILGIPAFSAMVVTFYLMVAKPALW